MQTEKLIKLVAQALEKGWKLIPLASDDEAFYLIPPKDHWASNYTAGFKRVSLTFPNYLEVALSNEKDPR